MTGPSQSARQEVADVRASINLSSVAIFPLGCLMRSSLHRSSDALNCVPTCQRLLWTLSMVEGTDCVPRVLLLPGRSTALPSHRVGPSPDPGPCLVAPSLFPDGILLNERRTCAVIVCHKNALEATYAMHALLLYFRSTVSAHPPCHVPLSLSDVRLLCCQRPTSFPDDRRLQIVEPGAGSRGPWLRPRIAHLEI